MTCRSTIEWTGAGSRALLVVALVLSVACVADDVRSEELTVAVAANFLSTLQVLEAKFEAESGHEVTVISGSTGLLYAQIRNGAPFDVLLAADQERPRLLAADGYADPAGVFTYAIGRLALWSRNPTVLSDGTLDQLAEAKFRWLAIAEPKIAPYGLAAQQVLAGLGIWEALQPRIVRGQNVAQVHAMVDTGNADLGFVALSQVLASAADSAHIIVPQEAHDPIRQDGIVLDRAARNPAAEQFVAFLKSAHARAIIERSGYSFPSSPVRQ